MERFISESESVAKKLEETISLSSSQAQLQTALKAALVKRRNQSSLNSKVPVPSSRNGCITTKDQEIALAELKRRIVLV